MKNSIRITIAALVTANLSAAPLKSAVVTTVVNDVKLSEKSSAARAISGGEKMGGSSTLLTGRKSRAAMTFPDKTITRVGANSVFSFRSGSRDMKIEKGSFLLQVPKNAGGATIRTATVTAGITGTTVMVENNPNRSFKFVCLEGTATLTHQNGEVMKLTAGQILTMHPNARNFPRPMIVNVDKMVKTSALADSDTFGELPADANQAIKETCEKQKQEKRDGNLAPAGLVERGGAPKDQQGGYRSVFGETFGSN